MNFEHNGLRNGMREDVSHELFHLIVCIDFVPIPYTHC